MLMHDAADFAIATDVGRVVIMVAAMMLGKPPPEMVASVAFFATDNDRVVCGTRTMHITPPNNNRVVAGAGTMDITTGCPHDDRIMGGAWAMQILPATYVIAVAATIVAAAPRESAIGRDHQKNRCRRDCNDTSRP
jgi:hypothetical protein